MARAVPRATPTKASEVEDWAAEASAVGLDHAPRTELGRLLLGARREFLAVNGRCLSREELERELAERRGGIAASDEE